MPPWHLTVQPFLEFLEISIWWETTSWADDFFNHLFIQFDLSNWLTLQTGIFALNKQLEIVGRSHLLISGDKHSFKKLVVLKSTQIDPKGYYLTKKTSSSTSSILKWIIRCWERQELCSHQTQTGTAKIRPRGWTEAKYDGLCVGSWRTELISDGLKSTCWQLTCRQPVPIPSVPKQRSNNLNSGPLSG